MKADANGDHYRESIEFEREFQQMVLTLFDISNSQGVDSHNRVHPAPRERSSGSATSCSIKPDKLTFSKTTADLRKQKDAYKPYHNASSFHVAEQQVFLYRCIDNKVAIKLRREATYTIPNF